jgi:hypothetical protein
MVLSVIGMVGWKIAVGWDHVVLGIEAALIALFAAFWAIQTESSGTRAFAARSDRRR